MKTFSDLDQYYSCAKTVTTTKRICEYDPLLNKIGNPNIRSGEHVNRRCNQCCRSHYNWVTSRYSGLNWTLVPLTDASRALPCHDCHVAGNGLPVAPESSAKTDEDSRDLNVRFDQTQTWPITSLWQVIRGNLIMNSNCKNGCPPCGPLESSSCVQSGSTASIDNKTTFFFCCSLNVLIYTVTLIIKICSYFRTNQY